MRQKRELVDRSNISISLQRQCDLVGVHKSGVYYKPKGESELNLELMRLIDEHYLEHPYKGAPRMHIWLREDKGFKVSWQSRRTFVLSSDGLASSTPRATYI